MTLPFGGGGAVSAAPLVLTMPAAVPAKRKRRFGYVCARHEPNQRSQSGNVRASA